MITQIRRRAQEKRVKDREIQKNFRKYRMKSPKEDERQEPEFDREIKDPEGRDRSRKQNRCHWHFLN